MSNNLIGEKVVLSKRETAISIAIVAVLFFVIGFISWVNAILIPFFKIACQLTNFESYFVTLAFYISYFFMSIPSSYLLKKVGFKKGISVGFWIMALGAFLFVPAALVRTYGIFLAGLFSLGVGLAIVQTAANPYVTILGPIERAGQRFSILGICNKGAGIIAPIIFVVVILRPTDSELFKQIPFMGEAERSLALDVLIQRVIVPYLCVGTVLIALGLLVRYSVLPEINTEEESVEVAASNASKTSIFHFPHLILSAVAIFLHVGTQVVAIDTVINYAATMNIPLLEAEVFPSYTLSATIVGYIIGIITIPKYISQGNALRVCTILGCLFSILILFSTGYTHLLGHYVHTSIWFIVLLGLPNSLIWAGIWPLALQGLGRFTKLGSSVMIMGLCGNALVPLLYGHLADLYDARSAYAILLPCYAYLIYYSFQGYRVKKWFFN